MAPHSHRTSLELLVGCPLSPEDWVTHAIGAIGGGARWTPYHKLIARVHTPGANLTVRHMKPAMQVDP